MSNIGRKPTRTGGRAATEGVIPGKYALSVGMPDTPTPDGWGWTPLSGVARLESGHTPSRKHPEYWGGDVCWIGIKDATDNYGRTIHDTYQHTNALGIANSSARILPKDTVCLSRTASVGYVVVMGTPMATSQDFINWVCSEQIDHRFLKYILVAEREALLRFASGTTHQTIYFPEAKAFHVCLPAIEEQRAIADCLQAIDDKIELLEKTNCTLESIAQTLFKSWFVDFDPVWAKSEGREPEGVPPEVADLFPDELVESELGMIPKGWDVGVLSDLVVLQRGFDLPTHSRSQGSVPVIAASGLNGFHNEYMVKGPGVVTGRSGVLGKVFLELRDFWPLNTTLWVKEFKRATPCYAFQLLRTIDFHTFNAGSAVPTLNRNHIHGLKFICPPKRLVDQYERHAMLLHIAVNQNEARAETLAELRDTLLPRLMSGKLRVAEAEKELEAV